METEIKFSSVQPKQRIFTMDVMRGVAVLGILLMNIGGFSCHQFFLFWGDTLAGELTTNGFIFKSAMLLFDGRMRGLFTLLFGAGIILFIENKRQNSIQVADAYFKRMTWLLIFGVIDSYILLWQGDVLFEYALCGIFIYVLRNASARYLLLLSAIILITISAIGGQRFFHFKNLSVEYKQQEVLLKKGKTLTEEQQKHREEFEEILYAHYPFSDKTIKEISKDFTDDTFLHRSGYVKIFEKHAEGVYEYQSTVFYSIFSETFGTILLGMALYKLGFFNGRFKRRTYWIMCVVGICIGLIFVAIKMKLEARTQTELWDTYKWRNFSLIWFEQGGRILSTLGYAALIYLLTQMQTLKAFLNLFANVGRMALTNYIMQTILCSLYFFGFGLGHYGEYDAKGLFLFVSIIWVIQITYSTIYLRYFQMGPLEWLWKRLTYGKGFGKVE